jgi:hypothetical protein
MTHFKLCFLAFTLCLSGCVSINNPIVFTLINDRPKSQEMAPVTLAPKTVVEEIKETSPEKVPVEVVPPAAGTTVTPATANPLLTEKQLNNAPSTLPEDFRNRPEVIAYVQQALQAQRSCSGFKLPNIPDVPEITRKDLEAIDRKDPKAMQELLKKHIRELHQHSTNWKNQVEESYARYRRSCK